MTKFDELERKVRHYRWLQGIAAEYEDMLKLINREKDHFTIEGFSYSARGDVRNFNVNGHRTIPYTFIRDGLQAELNNINIEIAECEKELDGWI